MERRLPSAHDLEDARSLQSDLAAVLRSAQDRSDAEILDDVRRVCQLARITVDDEPWRVCTQNIERHAECFFVVDDNVSWAWHTPARYARLRSLLLRLVDALATRLTHLENCRRWADRSTPRRPRPATRFAAAGRPLPGSRPE
jgi:hypothetical protein